MLTIFHGSGAPGDWDSVKKTADQEGASWRAGCLKKGRGVADGPRIPERYTMTIQMEAKGRVRQYIDQHIANSLRPIFEKTDKLTREMTSAEDIVGQNVEEIQKIEQEANKYAAELEKKFALLEEGTQERMNKLQGALNTHGDMSNEILNRQSNEEQFLCLQSKFIISASLKLDYFR